MKIFFLMYEVRRKKRLNKRGCFLCFIQQAPCPWYKVKGYPRPLTLAILHKIPFEILFYFHLRGRRIDLWFKCSRDNSNWVCSNRTSNIVIHTACAICRGCNCKGVISCSLLAKHVEHSLDVLFGWKCLMPWYFDLGWTSRNNVLILSAEQQHQTQHLKMGL